MNKYKNISPQSNEKSLEDCIQHRLVRNQKAFASLDHSDGQPMTMSTNKSIIFIKLPKSQTKVIKNFKLSFYDSYTKNQKQRYSTRMRQSYFPVFSIKKNNISNHTDSLTRITENQKRQTRRKGLPDLIFSPGKLDCAHLESYMLGSEQKQQKQLQTMEMVNSDKRPTLNVEGFRVSSNEQIQPRQISFRIIKKDDLLFRNRSRKNYDEDNLFIPKFKMEKHIEEHMNRYNKKDFFHANLNCTKTTLFPDKRICFKHQPNKKCECSKEHFSNFFRPRKIKRINLDNLIDLSEERKDMRNSLQFNPQKRDYEVEQCTPWETDKVIQD